MCKSALRHEFLKSLPKCEHHVHIEGTLEPRLLFELARRNGVTLSADDPAFESEAALLSRYKQFGSLGDFLHYYNAALVVLVTAADFEDLAWAYFERAAADGLVHTEFSFDVQVHLARGVALGEMISGLTAARARAQRELGISSHLICCFMRHLPAESALALLDDPEMNTAISGGMVTGIGLVSSENEVSAEIFEKVYLKAKALGLRRTAHAGEEGPPANISACVNVLCVERIDHGVTLGSDLLLMKHIAEVGLTLTLCPISNVRLHCVSSFESLPVRIFLNSGVRFSINSDDPSYFGAYILDNYCAVQDTFELSIGEWEVVCMNAINGSWCSPERKQRLLEQLRQVKNAQSEYSSSSLC